MTPQATGSPAPPFRLRREVILAFVHDQHPATKLTSPLSKLSRSISSTIPDASAVMLPRSPRWRAAVPAFAAP